MVNYNVVPLGQCGRLVGYAQNVICIQQHRHLCVNEATFCTVEIACSQIR